MMPWRQSEFGSALRRPDIDAEREFDDQQICCSGFGLIIQPAEVEDFFASLPGYFSARISHVAADKHPGRTLLAGKNICPGHAARS
jgi:hypothetical protein